MKQHTRPAVGWGIMVNGHMAIKTHESKDMADSEARKVRRATGQVVLVGEVAIVLLADARRAGLLGEGE